MDFPPQRGKMAACDKAAEDPQDTQKGIVLGFLPRNRGRDGVP